MKPKKHLKFYIALVFFIVAFVYIIFIQHYPFYYLFLAYLGFFLILAVSSRDDIVGYIGNFNFANGRIDVAEKIFKTAIKRNTKNPTIYLNQAIILVKAGNGTDALPHLQKALTLEPSIMVEKNVLLTMGSCYWVIGDVDRAIEVLEELKTKFDYVNCHVLTTLGYMYLLKGNFEEAHTLTTKAIEESPSSGAAWDNLGQIHYQKNELEEAKAAFLKAIEFNSNLVDSYYYLGLLEEQNGDDQKAAEYLNKASRCNISALNTVTTEQIEQQLKSLHAKTQGVE